MRRRVAKSSSHWSQLVFDGDEKNYELLETKKIVHLRLQGLKGHYEPTDDEEGEPAEDGEKNTAAYTELVKFLGDKSLSLVK